MEAEQVHDVTVALGGVAHAREQLALAHARLAHSLEVHRAAEHNLAGTLAALVVSRAALYDTQRRLVEGR